MVFSDLFFLYVFLTLCVLVYYLCESVKARNYVLIIASLAFYAWGEPRYIILLFISALVNYYCGLGINKYRGTSMAKTCLVLALLYNLGTLLVFKYTGFFVTNINTWFSLSVGNPNIALPIGISFYTFQITSYIIDCYWEKVDVQKSFSKLLLYISLFPQLVAGPIVRYSTIEDEISNRRVNYKDISAGITRFIVGLSKKAILANSLYSLVQTLIGNDVNIAKTSFIANAVGVLCFALYVYYDFSGYSDMAIGMGLIFGFHFNENFIYPFVSKNITEFWQRWHISLGTFFRDYLLYVPIFGKRRKYFSLFLVWFCTGFWHGASWNFIIWGLYFGLFIFIEQLLGKKRMKAIPGALSHLYSLVVIIIGFGIFYFEKLSDLGNFFKNLVFANGNAIISDSASTAIRENIFLIIVAAVLSMPVLVRVKKLAEKSASFALASNAVVILTNLTLLIISSIMLTDATNNPFLYFRF
ncbi:MAG: MBOAT family protein [Eubacteriales bacterium]|nr:MBOAT family protein [Eubacteriales bacterium]